MRPAPQALLDEGSPSGALPSSTTRQQTLRMLVRSTPRRRASPRVRHPTHTHPNPRARAAHLDAEEDGVAVGQGADDAQVLRASVVLGELRQRAVPRRHVSHPLPARPAGQDLLHHVLLQRSLKAGGVVAQRGAVLRLHLQRAHLGSVLADHGVLALRRVGGGGTGGCGCGGGFGFMVQGAGEAFKVAGGGESACSCRGPASAHAAGRPCTCFGAAAPAGSRAAPGCTTG